MVAGEQRQTSPVPALRSMESAHLKPTQSSPVSALAILAFLSAAGILMHMASYGEPLRALQVLIVVAAFIVIFHPSIVPTFLALLALHSAYLYKGLPDLANHSLLALCVDLTLLTAALFLMLSKRTWKIDPRDLYAAGAPVLRIECIVLYFFVVFHKLNTGYFNSDYSCSVVMYFRVATAYSVLPVGDWARVSVVYLALIIEAAIPIMLLVRPLRVAGLLLAFAFHFLLAMDPGEVIYNFSAMLLGLFFLFLPDDFPQALERTLAPARAFWARTGTHTVSWLATRAAVYWGMPTLMAALIFRREIGSGLTAETGRGLWVLYAMCVLSCFVASTLHQRLTFGSARELVTVRLRILLIFPALLFVNGLMPYLGAKTETSFAMFSNLRTEGGTTNHFFMPTWLQLWDYQRDLVTIHHTSIDGMQRQADAGWQWTYFEFRSQVQHHPDASLTYERGGVVRSLEKVSDDAELIRPDDPLLRKLLAFRPIPIDRAKDYCLH